MRIEIKVYKHDVDGDDGLVANRKCNTFGDAEDTLQEIKQAYAKYIL